MKTDVKKEALDYQFLNKFESFDTRDLQVLQKVLYETRPFMGLVEYLQDKYPQPEFTDIHVVLKDFAKVSFLRYKRGPM